MVITGLDHRDQTGDLKLALAGTIQGAFAVLNAPPLYLLRHAPPEISTATGGVKATITASIPFKDRVRLADVDLRVAVTLADVALVTPMQGLTLAHGAGTLQATADALKLSAQGQFGGEPADVRLDMSFAHGGMLRGLTVVSRAGAEI